MDETIQQMDYQGLLMNHLNRMSFVTTSSFIDGISKEMMNMYENPPRSGETAIQWGAQFLFCLIPDDLKDKQFEEDKESYENIKDAVTRSFARLKALINLMNRKGLLLSKQMPGRKGKPSGEVWD